MRKTKHLEFEMYTEKPQEYFRGVIQDWDNWFISCKSYAGGGEFMNPLFQASAKTKAEVVAFVRNLKKQHGLKLHWLS